MDAQFDLFGQGAPAKIGPEGFGYTPDLLTLAQEADLAARLAELPFQPFAFHGHFGNRQVVTFGYRYDYDRRQVQEAAPIPDFVLEARAAVAAWAGRPADDFVQCLINRYAPGAGIGWHRDKPQFGTVAGISLLAPCVMRLRLKQGDRWDRAGVPLAPRSAYLLTGPARTQWEHSITPQAALRYSITFRTLAEGAGG